MVHSYFSNVAFHLLHAYSQINTIVYARTFIKMRLSNKRRLLMYFRTHKLELIKKIEKVQNPAYTIETYSVNSHLTYKSSKSIHLLSPLEFHHEPSVLRPGQMTELFTQQFTKQYWITFSAIQLTKQFDLRARRGLEPSRASLCCLVISIFL